jgi:hypothetical protein
MRLDEAPKLQQIYRLQSDSLGARKGESALGSSDFDICLEIQYTSCVFGLALKS